MSLSKNYPHQLALLVVALQTDKLPICEHLDDPTEKSLIATLMTYMNNRAFRTPITISRKTLGNQIRVKRSTLFAKLKNLKEKGFIEENLGEKSIQFTEKAIDLMQIEWVKQADKKTPPPKAPSFRLGDSIFPAALISLMNQGLVEKQLRGLMIEAKLAKVQLQEVLKKFGHILLKYNGKTLFLVIRDILRKPEKYHQSASPPARPVQKLNSAAIRVLNTVRDNADYLLLSGEKISNFDHQWQFSLPNCAPTTVTDSTIDMLQHRMRTVIKAHIEQNGPFILKIMHQTYQTTGDESSSGWPILVRSDGRIQHSTWDLLYANLPHAARLYMGCQHAQKDRRIGQHFIVNRVRYAVETIYAGIATLRIESGKSAGRFMPISVDQLEAPEICWQAN